MPPTIPPAEALRRVHLPDTAIEAARPLDQSLEWALSAAYWRKAGLTPFANSSVPYVVNNSGRLSIVVAATLFANLCEVPPGDGPITVMELGAGSGLFAKLFLDTFRTLCTDGRRDFYDRLVYVVSDGSAATLADWQEREMFRSHADHVRLAHIDARSPLDAVIDGQRIRLTGLRAVFCNYVLDILPATVLAKKSDGVGELWVRAHVTSDAAELQRSTGLDIDTIRGLVASGTPEALQRLLPVFPLLDFETTLGPPRGFPAWDGDVMTAMETVAPGHRLVLNYGALDCLMAMEPALTEGGFVLVNDYGRTQAAGTPAQAAPQRFGSTIALGLDFPFIESCLHRRQWVVSAPPGDDDRGIHTRLIARDALIDTRQKLGSLCSKEVEEFVAAPLTLAREHSAANRRNEALDAYRQALERSPGDWHILGEIAEFVGIVLRDFEAGVQLAKGAIELNPWTSAWLWNVLGDCLYCLERHDDAHQAYLAAQRIHADARTELNLSYTLLNQGQHEAALLAVARGLAADSGQFRDRLLQKQQQILATVATRRMSDLERMGRRLERMQA